MCRLFGRSQIATAAATATLTLATGWPADCVRPIANADSFVEFSAFESGSLISSQRFEIVVSHHLTIVFSAHKRGGAAVLGSFLLTRRAGEVEGRQVAAVPLVDAAHKLAAIVWVHVEALRGTLELLLAARPSHQSLLVGNQHQRHQEAEVRRWAPEASCHAQSSFRLLLLAAACVRYSNFSKIDEIQVARRSIDWAL